MGKTKITPEGGLYVLQINGKVFGRFKTYKQANAHKIQILIFLKNKQNEGGEV